MKEIKVYSPKYGEKIILVDDTDFYNLSQKTWAIAERNNNFYAVTYISGKTVKMHRIILGLTNPKILTDHRDGNGLNNQRSNLRQATHLQNARNRKPQAGSTSRYLGVSWKTSKNRWYAGIRVDGKHIYCGMSKDEKEAALFYNIAAVKHFGEFANLNIL